ncbi:MAG: hypothetical protein ABSF03_33185, partial [Streptosporangiaceae bacterium]
MSTRPSQKDVALDDLRREFGDRWDITVIPQGYRAVLKDHTGPVPVVLYGRTPAELAESIRMAGVSPRQTATERVAEQFRRAADDAAQITHSQHSVTDPTSDSATHPRFTGATRASHPADQESFALMPVPLDHDARQQ